MHIHIIQMIMHNHIHNLEINTKNMLIYITPEIEHNHIHNLVVNIDMHVFCIYCQVILNKRINS